MNKPQSLFANISPLYCSRITAQWNDGRIGQIVDLDNNNEFHFIDYPDGHLNPDYFGDINEKKSPIVAKGLVGYWIKLRQNNQARDIRAEYAQKCYNAYVREQQSNPLKWDINLENEFFSGVHQRQEKECMEVSKAIYPLLTGSDVKEIEALCDSYWNYIEEKSSTSNDDKMLCVVLTNEQRKKLSAAEEAMLIEYNKDRKGYDCGKTSSKRLIAYLCGRLFCKDSVEDDVWISGKRFDDAEYCKMLFGFDVSETRRSAMGSGGGKPPKGYERVDKLFGNQKK